MRKLGTLVKLRFGKLHIGGVLALIHKLTDTLCGILPRDDLCRLGISRRSAFGKVNTVLCIPYRELTTLGLQACAAVIFLFEQRYDFIHRLLFLESRSYIHSCVL